MTYLSKSASICALVFWLFASPLTTQAQTTTTWEGDVNNSWFTAGNWTNGLPDINKIAIIADPGPGNSDCVIAQLNGAAARKIIIENGGELTMQSGSPALTVTAADNDLGILVELGGTLNIPGTIRIEASGIESGEGLVNSGTVNLSGTLDIDGVNADAIINSIDGTFNLDGGRARIGFNDAIGGDGIENFGIMDITTGGRFFVRNAGDAGINNFGTIDSEGTIRIGTNIGSQNIGGVGIDNRENFTSTGTIEIEYTASFSIWNRSEMTLGGTVDLLESNLSGIRTNASTNLDLNDGTVLTISDMNQNGIQSSGGTIEWLSNNITVTIDNVGADGITTANASTFLVKGDLLIGTQGTVGQESIENRGPFTIDGDCGNLVRIGDGALGDINDAIVNNSTIIYEGTDNGFLGTNNGVVVSANGDLITIANDNGYYGEFSQKVWLGCTNTNWNEGSNWSEGTVPTATDQVGISGTANFQPELSGVGNCGSLNLGTLATLSVQNNATLNVGDQATSIDNSGSITNEGTINVTRNNDSFVAIDNRSILLNEGTINITRGSIGINLRNGALLSNIQGATISITDAARAIDQFGTFSNAGTIDISGGFTGITTFTIFVNVSVGTIQIDGTSGTGLATQGSGDLINSGEMILGTNSDILGVAMDLNSGGLENTASGLITIGSGAKGIELTNGTLENEGEISIDNTTNEAIDIQAGSDLQLIDNTIKIGDATPTGGGILGNGDMTISGTGSLSVRTSASIGVQANALFANNGSFFTDQGFAAGSSSSVEGSGSYEVQGDWNCAGSTSLGNAVLIMSGSNSSSLTNSAQPLEVDVLFADETNGTLSLNSGLIINAQLRLSQGLLDLNGQVMTIGENAFLIGESETTYVIDSEGSGTGFITHTQALNAPAQVEAGGLGVSITSPSNLGDVTIFRRHYGSVGGTDIVMRTYEVGIANTTAVTTLNFTYLDQELGSINESDLSLFTVDNGNLTEVPFLAFDPATNSIEYEAEGIDDQFAFAASDRILTWTGAVSSDWFTAGNWDPQIVPDFNYNALIPDVNTSDPVVTAGNGVSAQCKSIVIEENAALTNDFFLQVDGTLDTAITVSGELTNTLELQIFDAGIYGISVTSTGSVQNTGSIRHEAINSIGEDVIINRGIFTNSSLITIEQSDGDGIVNLVGGTFNNQGSIIIGLTGSVSGSAIVNNGQFNNENNGLILTDFTGDHGIRNEEVGVFNNNGLVDIGLSNGALIDGFGIRSESAWNNTGTLRISNTDQSSIIVIGSTNTFINDGIILIGQSGPAGSSGIDVVDDATLVNTVDGSITINDTELGISNIDAGTSILNRGEMFLDGNGTRSINSANFTNTGLLAGNHTDNILPSIGGTISPGFSPGTIAFDGDQAFASGAILAIEVDGTGASEADLVTAEGTFDKTNLNLEVTVNYTPTVGDEITIISAGSLVGDFASVSIPPSWAVVDVASDVVIRFELPDLVWTGNVSSAWENTANWEPQIVPTFDYNVVIPDVNINDPQITSNAIANCKSIDIEDGGFLTVSHFLNIDGANNTALTVSGSLTNDSQGQIQIFDAGQHGISVTSTGSVINSGTILHNATDNIAGEVIRNAGTFENSNNINIQQSGEDAIANLTTGMFTNNGNINLGQAAGASLDITGIDNNGIFTNSSQINIDNTVASGIATSGALPAANFSNTGTINLGQNFINSISSSGFFCLGNTTNTGTINLDNANSSNLFIAFPDGIFNNEGQLLIGQNSPAGGGGIEVIDNGSLINANTGLIDIRGTDFGIINDGGTALTNAGEIFFDQNITASIFSLDQLTNTGLIGGNATGIFLNGGSISGTLSPGFSPGTFSFDGDQAFLAGTVFEMEVEGTGAGEADSIAIDGNLDLTNINLEVTVNYSPADNDEITLITTTGSLNGGFASVSLPPLWTLDIGSNSVVLRYELPTTFTWTGVVSSDWFVPGNWDNMLVPNTTSTVIIPEVNTNDPIIDGDLVIIKSMITAVGSSLTIAPNGNDLRVEDAAGIGITIDGQFTIGEASQFRVVSSSSDGVVVGSMGNVINNGFLTLRSSVDNTIDGVALRNTGGNITNQLSGTIRIENVQDGIVNEANGTFTNTGDLLFDISGPDTESINRISGTFSNTGTILGDASNIILSDADIGGTFSPGQFTPGLISFTGSQGFLSGTNFVMDVGGTGIGEADRIQVGGVLNLSTIDLTVNVNYTPTDGDVVEIITASVFTGDFASTNLPVGWSVIVGASIRIRYETITTYTWTGAVSSAWANPANWDVPAVPTPTIDVIIPEVSTNDPVIGSFTQAQCRSMVIESGGFVSIDDGRLDITNAQDTALIVAGELTNDSGALEIFAAGSMGIYVAPSGLLTNNGTVFHDKFDFINGDFWQNAGTVINTETLDLQQANGNVIENLAGGSFNNTGSILIGTDIATESTIVSGPALKNSGQFINESPGEIRMERLSVNALENSSGATFTNNSLMNIGQAANAQLSNEIIVNNGIFDNLATINIDRLNFPLSAIVVGNEDPNAVFNNEGALNIGLASDFPLDPINIVFCFATFTNVGELNIGDSNKTGIRMQGSSAEFINSGQLQIGGSTTELISGVQLETSATFENTPSGTIQIQGAQGGIRINAGTSFINLGFLSFDAISDRAIEDLGLFSNGGTLAGNAPDIILTSDLGGTLTPGFSPGTISFDEDRAFLPGTLLEMDVEGTAAGEADLVDVNGNVDLANLNLVVSVDYTPNDGDEVTIVTATSISNNFATTDLPLGWSVIIDSSVRLIYDAGVLPVELVRFEAVKVDNAVRLSWETAEEIDNEGFEILFSTDGIQWETIGFVAGNGDTRENQSYLFIHDDPTIGDNYYRLRQIDFDGQFSDSEVKIVPFDDSLEELQINLYPNPAFEIANIDLPQSHEAGQLTIIDFSGRLVFESEILQDQPKIRIDVQNWPAGSYLAFIQFGGEQTYHQHKFTISNY